LGSIGVPLALALTHSKWGGEVFSGSSSILAKS
jgi:hypothetical protein